MGECTEQALSASLAVRQALKERLDGLDWLDRT
jgi:hypothetical protein